MRYRTLGRTGLRISEIGYGAWGIGRFMWIGAEDRESLRALDRAIDLGLNFIDTALAYGDGHSETLVGQVVRKRRERVYVATKVPPKNLRWPARPGIPIGKVFPYRYILDCTDRSLKHLGLDSVDVQQFHVWSPEWLEAGDWRRAIEDLKKSGKVRFFGISINDYQPDSALETLRTGLIDCVQVIYNIYDPTAADRLFPLCQELNIGVIARVPLDEGGLTGNITADTVFPEGDWRNRYFRGGRKQQVEEHTARLKQALGDRHGALAQAALRFCLSHPAVSTVIPGMRSVRNVESNCAVSEMGPLPAPALAELKNHVWIRNFYGA
ncbi:MAG: aldo/keto reductase [Acidobacteria bacterium]|nr:aldo/keto reductase [Acidobacteriota bacterium]